MDRVKKYWQTVIKEREGFWSSLFSKYEEEKEDVDLGLYINNSSSRINTLLQLAADDQDEVSGHMCSGVTENSLEHSCETSDGFIPLQGDINQDARERELQHVNHPVVSVKKAEPTFVVEIVPEEEDEKWNSVLHSTKKLKLFESSVKAEDGIDDYVASDHSGNSSDSPGSEDFASNDGIAPNISMQSEPLRYVCRRLKPGSMHVPSPKRFKLV